MKILGIAGKIKSGKNALANYVNGLVLKSVGSIDDFELSPDGSLNVLTAFKDGSKDWGILDLYRRDLEFYEAASETIWPYVKNYSFADSLKALCVDLFELKPEAVYGNSEQRAAPTHLLWENMPGVIILEDNSSYEEVWGNLHAHGLAEKFTFREKGGPMSGREFMQFLGTEIGRKMYGPIWANNTAKRIVAEQSGLAIVTDVRFPNEVEAIKKAGGKVIRLTRKINDDKHESETALDEDVYDWSTKNFDAIVHNQDKTLEQSCKLLKSTLIYLDLI
jgi:hypothetical protein